jgi:outer membrane protein assembly factor BamB
MMNRGLNTPIFRGVLQQPTQRPGVRGTRERGFDASNPGRYRRSLCLRLQQSSLALAASAVVAEATPIVVNGVMYFPAGNQVVALDADTGKEIWLHQTVGGSVQTRAVGYWPGDRTNPARVLYTVGTKMLALNAATGNTDPGFGKEGVVDIEITWGGAPYVYKNLIIMGNNNGGAH